jgi:hypothetical protein
MYGVCTADVRRSPRGRPNSASPSSHWHTHSPAPSPRRHSDQDEVLRLRAALRAEEKRADQAEQGEQALYEGFPALRELSRFESQVPSLRGSGTLHQIPALAIRWTHDTFDGRSIFLHGKHKGKSIYQLADKLFRDDSAVEDLDAPLDNIVRYEGKLYSLRNRRATVFAMVQGTRRDKLMRVPCHLFDLGCGERDSEGELIDRHFWKAYTGRVSEGRCIDLRWMGHGQNLPLNDKAPLFGNAAPCKGLPTRGTLYEEKVHAFGRRHPEMGGLPPGQNDLECQLVSFAASLASVAKLFQSLRVSPNIFNFDCWLWVSGASFFPAVIAACMLSIHLASSSLCLFLCVFAHLSDSFSSSPSSSSESPTALQSTESRYLPNSVVGCTAPEFSSAFSQEFSECTPFRVRLFPFLFVLAPSPVFYLLSSSKG